MTFWEYFFIYGTIIAFAAFAVTLISNSMRSPGD